MSNLPKNSAYRSSIEFGSDGIIAKQVHTQPEEATPNFSYKGSWVTGKGNSQVKNYSYNPFTVVKEEENEDFGLLKGDEIKNKRKTGMVKNMKE